MRSLILAVALVLSGAIPAAGKDYSADRYDVTMRVMPDGSVQVTETIRLTFSGGPFTYIAREIPTRKTDGIAILGASMDGRVMRRGSGPGTFEARVRDSRVALRWNFSGTADTSHAFRVSYMVRGVVQRAGSGGRLAWQALPSEHPYRIAAARIAVDGAGLERPAVTTRRVAEARVDRAEGGWVIEARGIGSNGWISLEAPAPLAAGAVPAWQARDERQRALAPRMIQLGAAAAVLTLAVVLLIWRQYPAPPPMDRFTTSAEGPPLSRPPAIAAAVLAGGRSSNAHAPGTLFDLANRGRLSIAEGERRWMRMRRFTLSRGQPATLAPHEAALLQVVFENADTVDFSKAAARLARRGRRFRRAVNEDLLRLGLTDEHRRAARRRLLATGVILAALSVIAAVLVVASDAGPWALAVPIGIDLAATIAIVAGATRAELSDEGFREREAWREFRREIKDRILKGSVGSTGSTGSIGSGPGSECAPLRDLPYVVALGLGVPLSRFLKKHGADAALPPWFRTLADDDGPAAFAAFIGHTTASTGGGGGGSGAAGGGSSSAG